MSNNGRNEGSDNEDPSLREFVEVEFDVQGRVRETSYENRDSSSLPASYTVDRDTFYSATMAALSECMTIAQVAVVLLPGLMHLDRIIQAWEMVENVSRDVIDLLRSKRDAMKVRIEALIFLIRWIACFGKIALLYAGDLTYFVRGTDRFSPPKNRSIDELSRRDIYAWFGLTRANLQKLFTHWRVPERFSAPASRNRRGRDGSHSFLGEECFIVYLYHMIKGTPFTEMTRSVFGGNP